MNLKKAIEVIVNDLENPHLFIPPNSRQAQELLIEAGNQIYAARTITSHCIPSLLPGETLNEERGTK